MRRRDLLATFGSAALLASAGCTGDGGDTPAETPAPDDTPDEPPTPEPGEIPEPIELDYVGEGSETIADLEIEREGAIGFVIIHHAIEPFTVELFDADGNDGDADGDDTADADDPVVTLADEEGYAGANIVDIEPGTYRLEVETEDGEWEIGVLQHPPYPAGALEPEFPAAGEGQIDDFFGPMAFESELTCTVIAEGDGENVFSFRDSTGAVVATPIEADGPVSEETTVELDAAVGWVDTRMSGPYEWAIESTS